MGASEKNPEIAKENLFLQSVAAYFFGDINP